MRLAAWERELGGGRRELLNSYNVSMSEPNELTHLDKAGRASMVDVGLKKASERRAVAKGVVVMSEEALAVARKGDLKKGDLRAIAEVAGIMAAKRTPELIPLCHPLPLTHVEVEVRFSDDLPGVEITASVGTIAQTGVEMEALTAVCGAALTVYDMIKSVEHAARLTDIRLIEKHGGRSGSLILEQA